MTVAGNEGKTDVDNAETLPRSKVISRRGVPRQADQLRGGRKEFVDGRIPKLESSLRATLFLNLFEPRGMRTIIPDM